MDTYRNFVELKKGEREGIDFCICVVPRGNATTVVLAPHGGGIEAGTSEVARKIAENDLSLAILEGRKSRGNARLHIMSTNFDEPRCLKLVRSANNVVAVHGEVSEEPIVFLGGRDKELGRHIRVALERHGYNVMIHQNSGLHGISPANICNRGTRGMGAQLELSRGLRKTFFESLNTQGRRKPTDELAKFSDALREGLRDAGAL